jgi:ectoine hydroxylase-related dioxygenase (phytanoyl-CoA dioxygenase family)
MFTHPAIVDRIRSIFNDNLLLWASYFWNKEPGGAEIAWHQDASDFINFLHPPISITAWIAIDEVTEKNSCVKIIPKSNRDIFPLVEAPDDSRFEMMADPSEFDTESAVSMELEPGEFFLFSNWTVHDSETNLSDERRLGASIRVTPSFVDIDYDHCYKGYKAVQLYGDNKPPVNELEQTDSE